MTDPALRDDQAIRSGITRFIMERFAEGSRPGTIQDGTKLMGGTLLDSMSMLELTVYLEETYTLTIAAEEITAGNFGTVGSLVRFVAGRLAAG